jgi:arsenate reductase (thioredoxin)
MKRILILCTGNSCRSIMTEALLRHHGGGQVEVASAGSKPAGFVHPVTLEVLKNSHIETEGLRSKSWDEFKGQRFDAVITVCGKAKEETCPAFLGAPVRAHWGVEDPARVDGPPSRILPEFERVYSQLERKAKRLLAAPLEALDHKALKTLLDEAAKEI